MAFAACEDCAACLDFGPRSVPIPKWGGDLARCDLCGDPGCPRSRALEASGYAFKPTPYMGPASGLSLTDLRGGIRGMGDIL